MGAMGTFTPLHSDLRQNVCPDCSFRAWCAPAHLSWRELRQFNALVRHRRLIKRNECLHHAGSALSSVYVVHKGFLKTTLSDSDGREQTTSFIMPGEMVGMDAIGSGLYQDDTVALEDSSLCGMTFANFERLAHDIPVLQHHFHRALGTEITRSHGIMLLLGATRAEESIALFLLGLSKQFTARKHSGIHFPLPMTRQEIGNYLGLTIETVSRIFSYFNEVQLIAINGRDVEIKNVAHLQQVIGERRRQRQAVPNQLTGGLGIPIFNRT